MKLAWFLLNIVLPNVYSVYSEVGELLLSKLETASITGGVLLNQKLNPTMLESLEKENCLHPCSMGSLTI